PMDLPMMRVDSHQHFWRYSPSDYPWIPQGSAIHRDYLPPDLKRELDDARIDACIAVQARQEFKENRFLCGLAEQHEFIVGVVGWIDLRSEQVDEQAKQFRRLPKAVGVRHVVQDESDPDFMAKEPFRRGIKCLRDHQLVYDILIYAHQLKDAIRLVRDFPEQRFVLDHIAKPKIRSGDIQEWRADIHSIASYSNLYVKLSGMVTEADHQKWTEPQLRPYWQHILQTFGPDRILYGSDWPVIRLASEYSRWIEIVTHWLDELGEADREKIWGGNTRLAYLSH
ncbi:MAG: amidohydrolase family protein, partial [Pirellula sp.]